MKLTYRGIKYNNQKPVAPSNLKVSGKYRGNSTVVTVSEDTHHHWN